MNNFDHKPNGSKLYNCFCKERIQESRILEHSQVCKQFQKAFGQFTISICKVVEGTKDVSLLKLLVGIFSNAKEKCEMKLFGPSNKLPSAPVYPPL